MAVCRDRQSLLARCRLERRCQTTELLARSLEALRRSRTNLRLTSRQLNKVPSPPQRSAVASRGKKTKPMQPQLDPSEEVVLRRVALDAARGVSNASLRRLQDLHLIEEEGTSWRLTPLGRERLKAMPQPPMRSGRNATDEIERILAKFRRPRG